MYEAFIWYCIPLKFCVNFLFYTNFVLNLHKYCVKSILYTHIMQNILHVKIMAFTKDRAYQFVRLPH
jgi:hypothetical protein